MIKQLTSLGRSPCAWLLRYIYIYTVAGFLAIEWLLMSIEKRMTSSTRLDLQSCLQYVDRLLTSSLEVFSLVSVELFNHPLQHFRDEST